MFQSQVLNHASSFTRQRAEFRNPAHNFKETGVDKPFYPVQSPKLAKKQRKKFGNIFKQTLDKRVQEQT